MMKLLVIVSFLFFTFATSQHCPLPNNATIEATLNNLLIISDGSQTYSSSVTGSVQYVCQAQGDTINTYQEIALIATFTPNPGEAEQTRIMTMRCNSGTWSGVTNDGLQNPPASVVGVPPRTDCYRCLASFDRCRVCDSACDTGLERCTGSSSDDCCLVFSTNGECSDDCSSSGVNYFATNITDYVCTCDLTCNLGYSPNSNCTECINTNNVCDINNPCQNGGECTSLGTNNYTCNCTGTGYQGINCSDTYSISSTQDMPLPSGTSTRPTTSPLYYVTTRMMTSSPTRSPSPSPSLCRADNCGECESNSVCCMQCNDGYKMDQDGCSCAVSNDPFDVTLVIIIIAIVIGLLLLLIIGGLIAFGVYSYATKGKRKTFPLKQRLGFQKKLQVV